MKRMKLGEGMQALLVLVIPYVILPAIIILLFNLFSDISFTDVDDNYQPVYYCAACGEQLEEDTRSYVPSLIDDMDGYSLCSSCMSEFLCELITYSSDDALYYYIIRKDEYSDDAFEKLFSDQIYFEEKLEDKGYKMIPLE